MMTTPLESKSSLYFLNPFSLGSHGQEAFCSSTFTSPKKFFIFVSIGGATFNCLKLYIFVNEPDRWQLTTLHLNPFYIFSLPRNNSTAGLRITKPRILV